VIAHKGTSDQNKVSTQRSISAETAYSAPTETADDETSDQNLVNTPRSTEEGHGRGSHTMSIPFILNQNNDDNLDLSLEARESRLHELEEEVASLTE
jgi:hypothetical protein